jgi:hypothetical protein
MKSLKVRIPFLILTMILMLSTPGRAQFDKYKNPYLYKEKAKKAEMISNLGTFVPLTAGIIWWRFGNDNNNTWTGSVTLGLSGMIIGPSLGYYYGGCSHRGTTGIVVRTITGAITMGTAVAVGNSIESKGMNCPGLSAALGICAVGTIVLFIESLYDVSKVREIVNNSNREKARKAESHIALSPAYFADSNATGLQLQVTF